MLKKLNLYYVIVSLPFLLLLVGSVVFFDAISSTIVRNPHPQINYAIFCIILFGGVLILLSVHRLMNEAKTVVLYSDAVRNNTDAAALQRLTDNFTGDASYVLQMVTASMGRSISHQEQASIEHELSNMRSRLYRRNALPQYLAGLLVGMGLLGTFVGLLATLSDISTLISSFAELDMATSSPLLVFRVMIERMKAPMQSMSIAFSASMFGLLGSIVLGLMMVGIRRFQGDIASLLGSEVARHIEIALAYDSINPVDGVKAVSGNSAVSGGEEYKVLVRMEERLAEMARVQQRTLTSEIDDFQKQRADMLRTLAEQNEASNNFRSELQQLGKQFGLVLSIMEKSNSQICEQISELTVHMSSDAKESHKLLAMQMDEQRRLRESLDSNKIEERMAEVARVQQRVLSSVTDDLQKQRADILNTLSTQNEASNNFRSELQQLGRQLDTVFRSMEKGNSEIYSQITELLVHMAADAKESHKLLAMQVNEQKGLREMLDYRAHKQ